MLNAPAVPNLTAISSRCRIWPILYVHAVHNFVSETKFIRVLKLDRKQVNLKAALFKLTLKTGVTFVRFLAVLIQ